VVESRPTQRVVLGTVLLDAENDESADGLASPRTAPPPLPRGRLAGSARPLASAADTATPGDPSLALTPASCAPDTPARCPGVHRAGRAEGRGRATPTGPRGADSRIVPRPQGRTPITDSLSLHAMTLIGINRSIILPASDYEFPETTRDLDDVSKESRRTGHRRALSNSVGLGGQSTCLWIGGYDE